MSTSDDALFLQAFALHQQGRTAEAGAIYEKVLQGAPDHFDARHLLGAALRALGRFEEALASFDKAIALQPSNAVARYNRANVLRDLGRHEEALAGYDAAAALRPDDFDVLLNRALTLGELGRSGEALDAFVRVVTRKPNYAEGHVEIGMCYIRLDRPDLARAAFDEAIRLKADLARAHVGRGAALAAGGENDAALAAYRQACALAPDLAGAHNNTGILLTRMGRGSEALASFQAAARIEPQNPLFLTNLAKTLFDLRQYAHAVAVYDHVLAIKNDAITHYDRALALQNIERFDAASAAFEEAFRLNPELPFLAGWRLNAKMRICDWTNIEEDFADLTRRIAAGKKCVTPFLALSLVPSAALQHQVAELYAPERGPPATPAAHVFRSSGKMRIGYFSMDFQEHSVAHLLVELIERHDRSVCEVVAFSYGPDTCDDALRRRLERAFDQFIPVASRTDAEIAELARSMKMDIAVDLAGYTGDNRPGIFKHRAAPIQVNYLGYPGTLGSTNLDYILADSVLIPESSRTFYTEKVIALPDSYQANDSQRPIDPATPTRAALGLPEKAFVLCCFHVPAKITPATFAGWMRIMKRAENSVLWLIDGNPLATRNLRAEAARQGIDPARLIFAPTLPRAPYLARQRVADLCLDTLPYNGHTSTSDALWVGVPVITLMGETFAARVAASLLHAAGLPELVTSSQQAYEDLAVSLAGDADRFAVLKRKLEERRPKAPLFDTDRLARNIEAAYAQAILRNQAGQPPDHIVIKEI